MGFFKKFFQLLAIAGLGLGALFVFKAKTSPCNHTLNYSIGSFDERFGISREQFLGNAESMAALWNSAAGRTVLRYDPAADFKINLVFDDRQQRTIDERNLRKAIDLSENNYQSLVDQYNNLQYQHKEDLTEYNKQKQAYETDLERFNAEVKQWNSKGGAPSNLFKQFTSRKQQLIETSNSLDAQRAALNAQADSLNELAEKINDMAKRLNLDVNNYNGRFGTARQFDQGLYTGKMINIYQFNEESDLKLVMAHEMGHALNLDHIGDSKAVMYYLMGEQNLKDIQLTNSDRSALAEQCRVFAF